MASEAHDNVKKAMDAAREQELAAYIMRDVDLRQKAAQGEYFWLLILTTHSQELYFDFQHPVSV